MALKIPEFTTSIVDTGFTPEDEDSKKLYREVAAFARQGQPIVIFGPTGSGKEFLARHYYNTLIKTEFYEQYKINWPVKFEEIHRQYSAVYSDESLTLFLDSIKAGIFQTINSANIYPNLAESILFGHESRSFTDAHTNPGLLEKIKYGVLFMDEIGELPRYVQAKLLRAIDSEISEGCRISGRMNYSLKDLIIISATNQPREKIRNDFYFKLGIEVTTKGLDERPKDLRKSIPYFIRKAIGKRKDYALINSIFALNGLRDVTKIGDTPEINQFADEQAGILADKILERRWPGNFRALRTVIEAAIFRVDNPDNLSAFSKSFRENLQYYIDKYTNDISKTVITIENPGAGISYPVSNPDLNQLILKNLNSSNELHDLGVHEKQILSFFLSSTAENGFIRKDLEEYYCEQEDIRHTSEAHIRNRINRLVNLLILEKIGRGKATRYILNKSLAKSQNVDKIFHPPDFNSKWTGRRQEIDDIVEVLAATDRIYIQAPRHYGKSALITMFCTILKTSYNFYYYPLGETGIKKLFEDLIKLLELRNFRIDKSDISPASPARLRPYLNEVFKSRNGNKPVLIIDNAHMISETDAIQYLLSLSSEWQELILILTGDKMDNALQDIFHEIRIGPWHDQKPI